MGRRLEGRGLWDPDNLQASDLSFSFSPSSILPPLRHLQALHLHFPPSSRDVSSFSAYDEVSLVQDSASAPHLQVRLVQQLTAPSCA